VTATMHEEDPMPADRQTDPTDAELRSAREHRQHLVPHGPVHLYARDHPGAEPAIVLMHGFPDDLYDRLVPSWLTRRRPRHLHSP
jgi:hypothetical protein